MPAFRTKSGRCHLEDGSLQLASSRRGRLRRLREGNRGLYWSYLALLLVAVLYPLVLLASGETGQLLLLLGGAGVVLASSRVVTALRGFSRADEIPLDAITRVTATEGTSGLTRPRFVVTYERDGRTKRRYVMMPSTWLSYGEAEFERAVELFRDAGIDVEVA